MNDLTKGQKDTRIRINQGCQTSVEYSASLSVPFYETRIKVIVLFDSAVKLMMGVTITNALLHITC